MCRMFDIAILIKTCQTECTLTTGVPEPARSLTASGT